MNSASARLRLSVQCGERISEAPFSRPQLSRWAHAAIDPAAATALTAITLRFVGRREGRALNQTYRARDYATNVLTFSYGDTADIVLCLPVITAEAQQQRKTLREHLAHMIVHGVLHAQNHDHEEPLQAIRMERLETAILRRFRIADPYLAH